MTAPNISARHGFTTRFGGVSTGDYASLNLRFSCGDRIENVAENYNILGNALDMDLNFFLMDTPYVEKDRMIDSEIANKLYQCSPSTLLSVNKIIDVLLEQQEREKDSISY